MSEQVRRYKNLVALGIDAVKASEYDALHAEAEALRAENGRMNAQFNECARLFVDATDQACKAQRERDALAVELEAARGLLRYIHATLSQRDMPYQYEVRDISSRIEALINEQLTGT